MVSLRRRRLLGLCSGNSSFVTPLPLYCENLSGSNNSKKQAKPKSEHPMLSDDASILDSVEELEKEIVESREKIEFCHSKMQELVLYESRCDNHLNKIMERILLISMRLRFSQRNMKINISK